jgi:hypothetical protein
MTFGVIGALTIFMSSIGSVLAAESSKEIAVKQSVQKKKEIISHRGTPVQLSVLQEQARLKKEKADREMAIMNAKEKVRMAEKKREARKKAAAAVLTKKLQKAQFASAKSKNVVTPKGLKAEMKAAEKELDRSCSDEATATVNEPVLKALMDKTGSRISQLRKLEQITKVSTIDPEGAMQWRTIAGTKGVAAKKILLLEEQKKTLLDYLGKAKMDSLDQRRDYQLTKIQANDKNISSLTLKREKKEAALSVFNAKEAERKVERLNAEMKAWKEKLATLSRLEAKKPNEKQVKTFVKQKEKELNALEPLLAEYSEIAGKAKSCHTLALQKSIREKCLASASYQGGIGSCTSVLRVAEVQALREAGYLDDSGKSSGLSSNPQSTSNGLN